MNNTDRVISVLQSGNNSTNPNLFVFYDDGVDSRRQHTLVAREVDRHGVEFAGVNVYWIPESCKLMPPRAVIEVLNSLDGFT